MAFDEVTGFYGSKDRQGASHAQREMFSKSNTNEAAAASPVPETSQKVALIAASTNNCRQLKTYTQRPMGQVAVSSGRLKLSQNANSIVQKLTQIRMNPTA